MRKLLAMLLLTVGCGMTTPEVITQGAVVASLAADYYQTRHITAACQEVNPIIGKCGQGMPPEMYFTLSAGLHTATVWALPQGSWRLLAQLSLLLVEGAVVYHNYRSGY